jgi:tRNA G18 (ribose-2'-O)-methylase SpoU
VGSIFRAADAAGVEHLHLCGITPCPPNVKLAKTALGAMDAVRWTHWRQAAEAIAALQAQGVTVVAVETLPDAPSYTDFAWPGRVAALLGNEVDGLPAELAGRCDAAVRLPMLGLKSSLNVAAAAGIVLFEIRRQWGPGR